MLGANGRLEINAGGVVSSGRVRIGDVSALAGSVAVSGEGAQLTSSSIVHVGFDGYGILDISGGGVVQSVGASVGYGGGGKGEATVSGVGSQWLTNSDVFNVGSSGNGTLTIQDGGYVSSGISWVGHNSGSTGAVTVKGVGSVWSLSEVNVGLFGEGTLEILWRRYSEWQHWLCRFEFRLRERCNRSRRRIAVEGH